MLTPHSSWEEWFPPGLRGLAYLTSHIFTMVASALLWGQRSKFQTSWVITDILVKPLLAIPPKKLPMQDLFTLQGFPYSTTDDLSCFPSCSYILHSHIISFHFQFFFTSFPSFLSLSFTLILMTVISLWVNFGLCKALFTPALSHPPNPYDIYGSQSLLSLKLLYVGQCFISYEWRAWVKVHSWYLSEWKKLVVCEFRSPVCFAHPYSGWGKKKHQVWFRDKIRSGPQKKDVKGNFMITFLKKKKCTEKWILFF